MRTDYLPRIAHTLFKGAMDLQENEREKVKFVSRDLNTEVRMERVSTHSLPAIRRPLASGRPQAVKSKKRTPFAIKTLVCIMIAASCFAMRFLPWQWALDARQTMNGLFTYDLEFDESLGRLKFVQVLFPGVATVFNAKSSMQYPVDGILKSAYGTDGQDHVVFLCSAGATVKATADGRVIKRGVHEQYGNYLMIEHAGNMVSVYYGLKTSPKSVGDEVKGGDAIGTLTESGELVFELRINDKAQNPMRYLGAN